jgi:hypothetical protein
MADKESPARNPMTRNIMSIKEVAKVLLLVMDG